MRAPLALILVFLLATAAKGQEIDDFSMANLILTDFEVPQLAPGQSGILAFNVTNPYPWEMTAAELSVEIYDFRSLSIRLRVEDIESPPVFSASGDTSVTLDIGTMSPGERQRVTLTVETFPHTPSGGVFTQGSYFVRFRLEFDHPGGHAVMVSRGFFTTDEWANATRPPTPEEVEAYEYVGYVNLSYLGQLLGLDRVDGILPETGFGVKEPLPVWPFHLLAVGAVAAFAASIYYWRRERAETKPINRRRR